MERAKDVARLVEEFYTGLKATLNQDEVETDLANYLARNKDQWFVVELTNMKFEKDFTSMNLNIFVFRHESENLSLYLERRTE